MTFIMPRPKNQYDAKGNLKNPAPFFHTVKPDRIKLARAVEDALTGIIWVDDSQCCDGPIIKRYPIPDEKIGVFVKIREII
jgi:Holliday junction resolvase RusA-like endonuclease